MNRTGEKWLYWGLTTLCALCWAFVFVTQFTGFIGASRSDKIILLGSSLLASSIISLVIFRLLWVRVCGKVTFRTVLKFFLGSALFVAVVLIIFSDPPPFPEHHSLEITILEPSRSSYDETPPEPPQIQLVSIVRNNEPRGRRIGIDPSEMQISGDWQILHDNTLVWSGGDPGGIQYQAFMQAGMELVFVTGPDQGMVKLQWDGKETVLDLSALPAPTYTESLKPAFNLAKADAIRKILVMSGWIAEFIALTILITIISLSLSLTLHGRIIIRNPRVLVGSSAVFIILLFATFAYIKPVHFQDKNLENLIRKTLNNPDRPIYKHQLLTIASLDGTQKYISSLEGIQYLGNLSELKLRRNQIRDLSPVSDLRHLRILNLRENPVTDLAPLAKNTSLVYLNLYSNTGITTIAPLTGLTNLETLILAEVPVGEEISILKGFPLLKHLNLRSSGIADLSPIAGLVNLEYLNLYSNPYIKSILPIRNSIKLETLILKDVPIKDEIDVIRNFPNLIKLNLRNSEVSDTAVLGELMTKGALQNNIEQEKLAVIDIRNNPFENGLRDSYAPIRPFWENIHLRAPFSLPVNPTLLNPVYSHPAGFYTEDFFLSISSEEPNTSVHYTLDGSEPTLNSPLFTDSILIKSRKGDPNTISEIPLAHNWKPPNGEIFKATVIKAKVFHDWDGSVSATSTNTYFVDQDIHERFNLPVISIVTNPDNFFDYLSGIYVLGYIYDHTYDPQLDLWRQHANFLQRSVEWERPIHIEIFDVLGTLGFSQDGLVKIHGGGSRRLPQKSLRIYPQADEQSTKSFSYELFPDLINLNDGLPITEFNNFILRNSGQDWRYTLFRDALMQSLISHTSLATQAYRPIIVFLNGEYWGIHELRQRLDEFYLASTYNINPEKIVILEKNMEIFRGNLGDENHFSEILKFLKENNIEDPKNFEYIKTQIDIDNFIDYLVAEIYFANTDWPHNNFVFWRSKNENPDQKNPDFTDGRWRWIINDTDYGFGYHENTKNYLHNTLEVAENSSTIAGLLLSSLFQNESFKIQFINRFADHLNTSFQEQRVIDRIDQMEAALEPEMAEHIRRWRVMGDSIETWEQNVDVLRDFARNRPEAVRQQIVEHFGLQGTAALTLITDAEQGYILVNSIPITTATPGVENPENWSGIYFMGVPIQITAIPHPGYEFEGWQGLDRDQDQAAITLDMTGDLTLQANFAPIP